MIKNYQPLSSEVIHKFEVIEEGEVHPVPRTGPEVTTLYGAMVGNHTCGWSLDQSDQDVIIEEITLSLNSDAFGYRSGWTWPMKPTIIQLVHKTLKNTNEADPSEGGDPEWCTSDSEEDRSAKYNYSSSCLWMDPDTHNAEDGVIQSSVFPLLKTEGFRGEMTGGWWSLHILTTIELDDPLMELTRATVTFYGHRK